MRMQGLPFVLARKEGKEPDEHETEPVTMKNYGSGAHEVSRLALSPGDRVLVVDDVLATGGSLLAAARAAERCGAVVEALLCVAEIIGKNGRQTLGRTPRAGNSKNNANASAAPASSSAAPAAAAAAAVDGFPVVTLMGYKPPAAAAATAAPTGATP